MAVPLMNNEKLIELEYPRTSALIVYFVFLFQSAKHVVAKFKGRVKRQLFTIYFVQN